MKRHSSFRPRPVEALEGRVVLHHGSATISVVTGALHGSSRAFQAGQAPTITTLVDTSVGNFLQEYGQTRSVYFASIQARTATSADTAAFNQYTAQTVDLLAQQLLNNVQQSGQAGKHQAGKVDLTSVIQKKIDGAPSTASSKPSFNPGTLGCALLQSTPAAGASTTAVAVESLAQDNAIEAARVAILNSLNTSKSNSH